VLLGLVGLGEALGATGGRAASKALGTGFLSALDRVLGAEGQRPDRAARRQNDSAARRKNDCVG
jgi:hypothetical protein